MEAPLIDGGEIIAHRITGFLRREDAAKLYELAYFASGDILEIGTYLGLSASILAEAAPARTIHTVERKSKSAKYARRNLRRAGITNVVVHVADAISWLDEAAEQGMRFSLASSTTTMLTKAQGSFVKNWMPS